MNDQRKLSVARLGLVEYEAALRLQEAAVRARQAGAIGDTLLILEHPHVFTLGRGADAGFLRRQPDGIAIHRVSRGGQITYHGPGQLIGYPILKLEGEACDIGRYLRNLEAVMIDALARIGIAAGRREGMTGVWVGEKARLDRRRAAPLGHLSRLRAQRRVRPQLLRCDRAVRNRGLRDDLDRGAGRDGNFGRQPRPANRRELRRALRLRAGRGGFARRALEPD